jgi:hypothetical protein
MNNDMNRMAYRNEYILVATTCLALLVTSSPAGSMKSPPAPVPKTGQTNSYAAGDDGDLQKGVAWPDPRFTVQENTNVAQDNLTGLMWTRDAKLFEMMDWTNAVKKCNSLNYGGYADWRLPNKRELLSLLDAGRGDPALPVGHPFINIQREFYWSSTIHEFFEGYAANADMCFGALANISKTKPLNVWPVRGGQISMDKPVWVNNAGGSTNSPAAPVPKTGLVKSSLSGDDGACKAGIAWPKPRFTVGIETNVVTDNLTGLMWTLDANLFRDVNWDEAVKKCNSLNYGGYADWRLPNRLELLSLIDDSQSAPALPADHPFQNIRAGKHYWSSTSHPLLEDFAINVDIFNAVTSANINKNTAQKVWPVRGGE